MMTLTPDSDFERTAKSREAPESRARHIMSVVVLAGGWRWRYSLYARPNPPLRQCLRRRCRNASALRSAVLIYTRAQDGSIVELHIPDTPDSVTEGASEFAAAVSVESLACRKLLPGVALTPIAPVLPSLCRIETHR